MDFQIFQITTEHQMSETQGRFDDLISWLCDSSFGSQPNWHRDTMPVVSPKEAKVADTPKESAPDDSDADEAGGHSGHSWWVCFVFLHSQSHYMPLCCRRHFILLSSEVPFPWLNRARRLSEHHWLNQFDPVAEGPFQMLGPNIQTHCRECQPSWYRRHRLGRTRPRAQLMASHFHILWYIFMVFSVYYFACSVIWCKEVTDWRHIHHPFEDTPWILVTKSGHFQQHF